MRGKVTLLDRLQISMNMWMIILKAQKLMNAQGSMKLTGVNDSIMEVFDITGFLDILTIE